MNRFLALSSGYRPLALRASIAAFSFAISVNVLAKEKAPKTETLCPGWTVVGEISPGLSDTEKRLVCGDDKADGWKQLPISQAVFNFKNFLQDRALYHPVFEQTHPGAGTAQGAQ